MKDSMNTHRIFIFFHMMLVIVFLCGCTDTAGLPPNSHAPIASDRISEIISHYRQEIPQMMKQDNIPGLAIAIVDDKSILWLEGFGYTDWNKRIPVTQDTLFSIQSMSKSFTATAAMFAAQDSLVDLDAPITNYLPNFRVNSIFEDHPEQKITLRILLSHTAGLTHEAPYGGNFDLPAYSFEKHVASISDTWLKFPVGMYYAYSNLGIDLAGYILQERSGIPFIQYVQEKVLQPLGMKNSTLDVNQVRARSTRAIGHTGSLFPPPVDFLLIPSGGVWTTAADMTRYLQFHINEGALDGKRLLQQDLAETMYTPPNMAAQLSGYALGITVSVRNGARHFQHGGGGFGFNTNMVWYPDLKLGSVVLTNAHQSDSYCVKLSESVLDDIIASSPEVYAQRLENSSPLSPAYLPVVGETPLTNYQLSNLITGKAIPDDASAISRRSNFAGKYIIHTLGIPGETVEVSNTNGKLSLTYLGETAKMTEVEPGLFFSPTGAVLDLRGPDLLFNNIHIIKANLQTLVFRSAFYSICGLLFLFALLFWPLRSLIRGIRQKKIPSAKAIQTTGSAQMVYAGVAAGIASFFSLLCLIVFVLVPNLVYFSWPHPYAELTLWQHLLFYLPYISIVLAGLAALLAVLASKNNFLVRFMRIYFLITILVLLVFNIAILV
jgi:CubicO group peptidase (beta-lactamase class C family)